MIKEPSHFMKLNIKDKADVIKNHCYIDIKNKNSLLKQKIQWISKRKHKISKTILFYPSNKPEKRFYDHDYRESGEGRYVSHKNSAYVYNYLLWDKRDKKPVSGEDGEWVLTSQGCKTRLVYSKIADEYFWQCRNKVEGKWINVKYLCPAEISDKPKERAKQIKKWAKNGIKPDAIVKIINKIKKRGNCKKGVSKQTVYRIIKDLREKKYQKLDCPIEFKKREKSTKISITELNKLIK